MRADIWLHGFDGADKRRPVRLLSCPSALACLRTATAAPITSVIRGHPRGLRVGVGDALKVESATTRRRPDNRPRTRPPPHLARRQAVAAEDRALWPIPLPLRLVASTWSRGTTGAVCRAPSPSPRLRQALSLRPPPRTRPLPHHAGPDEDEDRIRWRTRAPRTSISQTKQPTRSTRYPAWAATAWKWHRGGS
jgi:hypothetical protein